MGGKDRIAKTGRAICFAEKTEKGWELDVIGDDPETADRVAGAFGKLVGANVVGRRPQRGERETGSQHFVGSEKWKARWQPTGPGGRSPLRPVD